MQKEKLLNADKNNMAVEKRLYFIDWLRILAILTVFLLHSAKIFDYHTTVVVNSVRSPLLSAVRDFWLLWVMPLFFVLSGASVFLSGRTVKKGKFVKSRFMRLVIPLLFIGTFVINPVYVYIERLSEGVTALSFFEWFPEYFSGFYMFGGNFVSLGNGTHLWYLQFLFIYSLILLPLFKKSGKKGTAFLTRVSVLFEKPAALFLLFLPVSVFSVIIETTGLGGMRIMGGWDQFSYIYFYIAGYMIFSNDKIQESIKKYYPVFLTAAAVLTVLYIDTHFGFIIRIPGLTRHDMINDGALFPLNQGVWTIVLAVRGLISWCWIIGLLGLFKQYVNFKNKFVLYANEALIAFYILHHAVIYCIGYYVIQLTVIAELKFLIIASVSFALIMLIYEVFIKRLNAVRFLFGMKIKKPVM
jgi:glucans biosynthesis protein C